MSKKNKKQPNKKELLQLITQLIMMITALIGLIKEILKK